MRPEDAKLTRRVKSEFIRRELNMQKLDAKVLHGVAYLGGELGPTRHNKIDDYKKEFAIIEGIIRALPGIRDVVNTIKWVAF